MSSALPNGLTSIPNGWSEVTVNDVASPGPNSMATGPFGSSISSRYFRSAGIPVIRGGNLSAETEKRLIDEDLVFLDAKKASEFRRSTARAGDLIFTCWGTINQVGLIDESAAYSEYIISNKQMKLTPDPKKASPAYLYYLFSGPEMQQEILEGAIGSSIPGFNLTRLRSLKIALPPLPEQEAIARALSDADESAHAIKAVITKKQAIKQGVMRQLLTGKTRLPGFVGDWQKAQPLSRLTTKNSGYWGTDSASPSATEIVRVIRAGDISPTGKLTGFARRYFTKAELSRAKCHPGDVVITASGNGLGKAWLVNSDEDIAGSNFVRILRPRSGVAGPFVYHVLRSSKARAKFETHTATSAYPNLLPSFFADSWIDVPPLPEQHAIAQVLNDMDSEIEALAARLDKARAIKQGIMQELLTGRTRVLPQETKV